MGVKPPEYKTRRGFCHADGLIALNWRLVQVPLSVIDYVIVHELTHRSYPHHCREFWAAVRSLLPQK
ncbi:M48 metallopeptidase family protein [Sulfobacillus thermosulfidooxidans]|uniref:M48 metallopeptidase family protein n=1 Tax=Sulfobacillus thermosulfidooxidans TaxID=28034 RepID=UPI003D6CA424